MRYSFEQPLWDDFGRRTKQPLSPVDTKIYGIAQTRLVARVMTGSVPEELCLSPWPETNTSGLNTLMKQTWKEAIAIVDRHEDPTNGASSVPPGPAARKVRGPWIQ
jgi:hypothetical protein